MQTLEIFYFFFSSMARVTPEGSLNKQIREPLGISKGSLTFFRKSEVFSASWEANSH